MAPDDDDETYDLLTCRLGPQVKTSNQRILTGGVNAFIERGTSPAGRGRGRGVVRPLWKTRSVRETHLVSQSVEARRSKAIKCSPPEGGLIVVGQILSPVKLILGALCIEE